MMSSSPNSRLVLNKSSIHLYVLTESGNWHSHWSSPDPDDPCDSYDKCGPHGMCNLDSSKYANCTCLNKFEPTCAEEWKEKKTPAGCQRRVGLNYTKEDKFIPVTNMKFPDTINVTVDSTVGSKC